MTTYGVTSAGLVKKPGSVIKTELTNMFKGIYGENIQLNDGPIAQEIGTKAEREAALWNLAEAVYLAGTRAGSTGVSLDNTNALVGVGRIAASNSTVNLTLCTLGGSDVPVGSGTQINQEQVNVLWETTAAATIPAAVDTTEDLVVTDVTWQSGTTVRYQCASGSNLSSIVANDKAFITGCSIDSNNGLFNISAVNDGSDWFEVTNPDRTDSSGDEASITAEADVTDGFVVVTGQSVDAGAFTANFGTIEQINTPISGMDFAGNLEAAVEGTDEESDADYRRRAQASTVSTDGGTLAAVKNKLLEVDGVTAVFARENRTETTDGNGLPPHSQQYTVIGGTDQDVAAAIYQYKAAGINTFGATSANVTNDYGDTEVINFSRVTEITIHFDATITHDSDYPSDGDDQVKAALVAYGATLSNGDDVINDNAKGYITFNVPGITGITLLQGLSDPPSVSTNIAIATTEIASIATANIDVTS